ncbi:MAG: glycosyltransferase [Nitrososphaerota archaeon]|nr:glycosyltransferase [Nitrososphaerota archaeon]
MLSSNKLAEFSIGICASDTASNLQKLLELIQEEEFSDEFLLRRIVIVASGCPFATIAPLYDLARRDQRVVLIEELERRGKAEALNRIIECAPSEYLLFINSDALPVKGAMNAILKSLNADDSAGVVSGSPFFDRRGGWTSRLQQLMWMVHNECSERLNHMAIGNHGSDELIAVRTRLLERMPVVLVNDGAYIAGRAKLRGYLIKYCSSARVEIDVPTSIVDTISQRRRIIFGHFQIWSLVGKSPKTVESMVILSPRLGAAMVVKTLAQHPDLILTLPIALVEESIAFTLAVFDRMTSTNRHGVWRRYGS